MIMKSVEVSPVEIPFDRTYRTVDGVLMVENYKTGGFPRIRSEDLE